MVVLARVGAARRGDREDLRQVHLELTREGSMARSRMLFDMTRGLPQLIEGQFRRHWGFAPALWNLYFRTEINLGISLSVKQHAEIKQHAETSAPSESRVEDAAMAAAKLVKMLEHGYYMHVGISALLVHAFSFSRVYSDFLQNVNCRNTLATLVAPTRS